MQLSKEENARKRIHTGSLVQIENSITRVTVWHHKACQAMPNSYPSDGIYSQHLTTINDSCSEILVEVGVQGEGVFTEINVFDPITVTSL